MAAPAAEPEEDFLAKHFRLRARRLPLESDFYARIHEHHTTRRQALVERWGSHFGQLLPDSTRDFYNKTFVQISGLIDGLLDRSSIDQRFKAHARASYAYRLDVRATLRNLYEADVFADKTYSADIPFASVLEGIGNESAAELARIQFAATHMFLHRPQQSEHLFLHELAVGFLGNLAENDGIIPSAADLPLTPKSYWTVPAYTVSLIGQLLGRSADEVAALHFADDEHIEIALPRNMLDLMLVSAHIYWYLMHYCMRGAPAVASEILGKLLHFFVIPSLERIEANGQTNLVHDAGRLTDRILITKLVGATIWDRPRVNEAGLLRLLLGLVDTVWAP